MKARAPLASVNILAPNWPAPGWDQIPVGISRACREGICVSTLNQGSAFSRKNARCGQTRSKKLLSGSSAIRRYSRPTPSVAISPGYSQAARQGQSEPVPRPNPRLHGPAPGQCRPIRRFSTWILVFTSIRNGSPLRVTIHSQVPTLS